MLPMQGKPLYMCYGRKTDFVDSSELVTLLDNPSILTQTLSDLLTYASYAHHPPEVATLALDSIASRLPIIPVDYVPFGLSCQALAVKIYKSSFRDREERGVMGLPDGIHVEFLKVEGVGGGAEIYCEKCDVITNS